MNTRSKLPALTTIHGVDCKHIRTLKSDTVATTSVYEAHGTRYLVKLGHPHPALLIFGRAAARYLIGREAAIGQRLDGIPGIPAFVEQLSPHCFARDYIDGQVLHKKLPVPDDFFDRLLETLTAMHQRGVVHIDIEKPQNILLSDDGKPYLIDFQISFCVEHLPAWLRPVGGIVFRRFVAADLYHFYKHKRRTRPDLTTAEEEEQGRRTGPFLALHRVLTKPYFWIRRIFVTTRGEEPPPGGLPKAESE